MVDRRGARVAQDVSNPRQNRRLSATGGAADEHLRRAARGQRLRDSRYRRGDSIECPGGSAFPRGAQLRGPIGIGGNPGIVIMGRDVDVEAGCVVVVGG